MRFELEFDCDGPGFDGSVVTQIHDTLLQVANDVLNISGDRAEGMPINDSLGNKIGTWDFTTE
jgi:hypothetical protein